MSDLWYYDELDSHHLKQAREERKDFAKDNSRRDIRTVPAIRDQDDGAFIDDALVEVFARQRQ